MRPVDASIMRLPTGHLRDLVCTSSHTLKFQSVTNASAFRLHSQTQTHTACSRLHSTTCMDSAYIAHASIKSCLLVILHSRCTWRPGYFHASRLRHTLNCISTPKLKGRREKYTYGIRACEKIQSNPAERPTMVGLSSLTFATCYC